jgi:gas vesicle protein
MKKVVATLAAGLMIGGVAASYAKLPPAPPKTDEQKAAEAQKAAADKAKEGEQLNKAQDKAVANYKKNAASMDRKK